MAKKRKTIFLVVQMGGTSGEWYSSTYDNVENANDAIKGHKAATYNAIGPYEVPAALYRAFLRTRNAEGEFLSLLDDVCGDVGFKNFNKLEPAVCKVCGEKTAPYGLNEAEICNECQSHL